MQLAVESLPGEVVYVGFSLGVLPAQSLAQRGPARTCSAIPLDSRAAEWRSVPGNRSCTAGPAPAESELLLDGTRAQQDE